MVKLILNKGTLLNQLVETLLLLSKMLIELEVNRYTISIPSIIKSSLHISVKHDATEMSYSDSLTLLVFLKVQRKLS